MNQVLVQLATLSPKMHPHQVRKLEALASLVARAPEGDIVDLGTFRGESAFALASTGRHVYTIDDYINREGWAREKYGPSDRYEFRRRFQSLNGLVDVTHIGLNALPLAGSWERPVALLHVDLGVRYAHVTLEWARHLTPVRALLVMHDTGKRLLGSKEVEETLMAAGEWKLLAPMADDHLHILERGQ